MHSTQTDYGFCGIIGISAPSNRISPSTSRTSPRGAIQRHIQLPPSPALQDVPRIEEQLATTFSLLELTAETIKQAKGPAARGMIEDLVKQCEKYEKF